MATAALMEENAVDAAVADAAKKTEEYERVRDEFVEQIRGINLVSECLRARREAKDAVAKARRLGAEVRTPDSVAVVLAARSGAQGRDAIVELQRDLMRDL